MPQPPSTSQNVPRNSAISLLEISIGFSSISLRPNRARRVQSYTRPCYPLRAFRSIGHGAHYRIWRHFLQGQGSQGACRLVSRHAWAGDRGLRRGALALRRAGPSGVRRVEPVRGRHRLFRAVDARVHDQFRRRRPRRHGRGAGGQGREGARPPGQNPTAASPGSRIPKAPRSSCGRPRVRAHGFPAAAANSGARPKRPCPILPA